MTFPDSSDLKSLFESLYKYRFGNTETVFEDIYQSIENITYDTYIDNSSDYVQENYTIFNQSFTDIFRRIRTEFGGFGLFDSIFDEETLHFIDYAHEHINSVKFIDIISYFVDKFKGDFFDSLVLKLVATDCNDIE